MKFFSLLFILLVLSACQSQTVAPTNQLDVRQCFTWMSTNQIELFQQNIEFCKQARDPQGLTPFMMAVGAKKTLFIDSLLKSNVDIEQSTNDGLTALSFAVNRNDFFSVNLLRQMGARSRILKDGVSPLMLAARNSSIELVKIFNPTQEEIRETAADGWTALHFAVARRNEEVTRYLLDRGACVKPKKPDDETVLQIAREAGWKQGLRMIQKALNNKDHC